MKRKLIVLIILAALTLASCAPRASTILSPEEGAAFAAEVDEIVENMLIGFSQNDYSTLARDWDPDWKEAYDENAFHKDYEAIIAPYGAYQSKTLDHVEDRPGFSARRIVFYHVVFENAQDVTVQVYFKPKDPDHQILGLGWVEE
jgi:hypothetical protein